jgi:hypothetical protein
LRRQLPHQLVQSINIRRQRGEIDVHTQNLTRFATHPRDDYHRESISRSERELCCSLSQRQQVATGAQARASQPHQ